MSGCSSPMAGMSRRRSGTHSETVRASARRKGEVVAATFRNRFLHERLARAAPRLSRSLDRPGTSRCTGANQTVTRSSRMTFAARRALPADEQILARLLLLARPIMPDFVGRRERRPGSPTRGRVHALDEVARARGARTPRRRKLAVDPEGLRAALDALFENAVNTTENGDHDRAESRASGGDVVIRGRGQRRGRPVGALDRSSSASPPADAARTSRQGGVALGLAIVDAIAKAHGGVARANTRAGAMFTLRLPRFRQASVAHCNSCRLLGRSRFSGRSRAPPAFTGLKDVIDRD